MTKIGLTAAPKNRFSATAVNRVVRQLLQPTKPQTQKQWLEAVAARTTSLRPDLAETLLAVLGCQPAPEDHLRGLTIGEIGVCYEALTATVDAASRKDSGQYFTPDDVANFMAKHSIGFPKGMWLDPCCGVGNLTWHLASIQDDPEDFVRNYVTLIDADQVALKSAVALLGADFLPYGDTEGLIALNNRSQHRDFLSNRPLPEFNYSILNPPYARTELRKQFRSAKTRDLFAYFLEKVSKTSEGFISVTPASYLSAPKFQPLREEIEQQTTGGKIFVFDNVPDTLFRGYKFGSANTSSTNFVRAAVTICKPSSQTWKITPIIRWKSASREKMLSNNHRLLQERYIGPNGEWVKLMPGMQTLWNDLQKIDTKLSDITVNHETNYFLTVATTPRYYISAAYRNLDRGSKVVLYFANASDRDRAAVILNSSLPYIWWRSLDGGVTLTKRVLSSIPITDAQFPSNLPMKLCNDEQSSIVTKLNAGRINENVKRPSELVEELNKYVIPSAKNVALCYTEDMFSEDKQLDFPLEH